MSKATPVHTDPRVLRPIIEALIFASEEPLAPRLLVRLLAGERDEPKSKSTTLSSTDDADADVAPRDENSVDENGSDESRSDGSATLNGTTTVGTDDRDAFDAAALDAESTAEAFADRQDVIGTTNAEDLADVYTELMLDEPVQSIDQRLVRRLVDDLNNAYEESGRAFRIVEVAGGFQFATIRDYGEYVALLSKEKLRRRLSPAALETLAIIAFRQPISKPEIEGIRGVNSDQVLLSLLEKNLVCITGRSESVGRPLLYGTSEDFLRIFGLNSLSDLPKLREIEELMEDNAYSAERLEVVNVPLSSDAEEIEALVGAAGHPEDAAELAAEADEEASGAASYDGDESDASGDSLRVGDDANNAGIDNEWVDEVGAIGEDDGGLTHDSESHALDEVEAMDARDDAYEFTIGPDDVAPDAALASDAALAHGEHDTDGATHSD